MGEPLAAQVALGWPVYQALNSALTLQQPVSCPVRFVAQAASVGAAAYESFIWTTQTVPTRNNLHDFFNGLVWLHFPLVKARLNQLQAAAIEEGGVCSTRGNLRDALTLFDENAAFLIEKDIDTPLLQAIHNKAWQDAFVARRMDWAFAEVVIFGHALLEKLVSPRKAMTAHVFCPATPLVTTSDLDPQISAQLCAEYLQTKPYAPLPVLGIPAWSLDNANALFYDDAMVFRPHMPARA